MIHYNPRFYEKIKKMDKHNISIVADFDATLTHFFDAYGEELSSINGLIRRSPHVFPVDFIKESSDNYNRFKSYLSDGGISQKQRNIHLDSWYRAQRENTLNANLTFQMFELLMQSKQLRIRAGVIQAFELLQKNDSQIYIVSASGFGYEGIPLYFNKHNISMDNMFIISNGFEWNTDGSIVKVKGHIVHSCNKHEHLNTFIEYNNHKKLQSVILLGDSLSDINMTLDEDANTVLRIGFLNKQEEQLLPSYIESFDVVITGDADFSFVYETISTIFSN